MEERLKILLYNAISLLSDMTVEQYNDTEEWSAMVLKELGSTKEELEQYGVSLAADEETIEDQKEYARNRNALMEHLIELIESNDARYSFEWQVGDAMEIYDKEKGIGYVLHALPIK